MDTFDSDICWCGHTRRFHAARMDDCCTGGCHCHRFYCPESSQDSVQGRIENTLDGMYDAYKAKAYKVAEEAYRKIVKPFLRERGWRFVAGMGAWGLWDENDEQVNPDEIDYSDDVELRLMVDFLETPVPGFEQSIGSLMEDSK